MSKDMGASSQSEDRAVVNGAGQAVSALRASVPSAALFLLAKRLAAGEIKALSIKQPYPHHIFHDGKDVENRDWPTKGRGWFAVHAGVSKSECARSQYDLPRGGIVGMARIVNCVTEWPSQWFCGRYGFVLADAFPVPLIPCKGQLGFFRTPDDVTASLSEAVLAQAIEARRAETGTGSVVDESAVPQGCAPTSDARSNQGDQ